MKHIWNDPSPQTDTVIRPGQAAFAPIAQGSEYPIVPIPPEVRNRPCLTEYSLAAHIWFCPTSATTIASSGSFW